ncbi:MAG: hypothetical protein DVB26_07465 [Verrucomicrobia bacterium]|nr:MAG: hypothetical protein DVB26_07465 [Verrucomicrobiota bacterium]
MNPLELAEKLRKARQQASVNTSKMTSAQVMEQMFRNGSDKKPNPWYRGPGLTDDSLTLRDSERSPLISLR